MLITEWILLVLSMLILVLMIGSIFFDIAFSIGFQHTTHYEKSKYITIPAFYVGIVLFLLVLLGFLFFGAPNAAG